MNKFIRALAGCLILSVALVALAEAQRVDGTPALSTIPVPVAQGGTNCVAATVTCFNNITGFTAAGTTGTTSTNLVFSTSPTLVTPVLGAATGTSLALGGCTIGTDALCVTGTTTTGAITHTGALTYGGVTLSNAVTGTGNMVLSASPTLSGTVGGALTFSGAHTLSSALTYGGVTLSNAVTGTGNMVLATSPTLTTPAIGAATGTSLVLTNTSATGLAVGAAGSTNPAFVVDSSTASAATGLKVKAAAAAGGLALSVSSSGAAENLTLDALGTGTITIGGTSTGAITLTRATTMSAALTYGGVTLSNAVTGTGNMVLSAAPTLTGTASAANIANTNAAGYELLGGATSATVPVLIPSKAATTTGWGSSASGAVDGVVAGTNIFRLGTGSHAYAIAFAGAAANETGYLCYNSASSPANEILLDTVICLASLEEYKNILGPIKPDYALSATMKMDPFWFTWNQKTHPSGDTHEQAGLGAHAMEKIDKRLVTYDSKGHLKGVHYDEMSAFLVADIQALEAEHAQDRSAIAAQAAQIKAMQARLAAHRL